MTISTSILKSASKSIEKLFSDSNLISSITFKSYQGSTFDPDTGLNADLYIDFSILSIRTEKKRLILGSPGEMGGISGTEVNYLIRAEDMPTEYSTRDVITHNSTNYSIEKITPILTLAFKIQVVGA